MRVNLLRRKSSFRLLGGVLAVSLAVGLLSGCGGEYTGMSGENGVVSGGAVSGQAVTGQAVSEKKTEEKKLQWCNDTNLYYYKYEDDETFIIVERNKEEGSERKFTVKYGNGILWADNDWIYYIRSIWDDENVSDQFWRAPMETEGASCHANWEKEELILEEDEGIDGVMRGNDWIFCNDRWIAYVTGEGEYRQYDIKEKKMVPQTVQAAEEGADACMTKGNAKGAVVDFMGNSYWLDGSTGKLVPCQNSMEDEDVTHYDDFVLNEGICMTDFYQYDKDENPVFLGTGIDFYHYPDISHPDGWTEQLVSMEEEKELLEKEGLLKHMKGEDSWYNTTRIFARGQTLYQQIKFEYKEGGVHYNDIVMLSYRLGQKGSLQVDRELTQIMRNPESNQKVFQKIRGNSGGVDVKTQYLSNGLCVYMTETYAFFIQSDVKTEEWQLICYEFDSGKTKVLDKEDEEWYLLYEDRSAHPAEEDIIMNWINYMPDNGGCSYDYYD